MYRIGVVTQISYAADGDALCIRAGFGDDGLHDVLAEKTGPTKDKWLPLPPGMYTRRGTVTGWRYPDFYPVGVVAGQDQGQLNPEAVHSYDETGRCLRMAGLALGYILDQEPAKIVSHHETSLVFGEALLDQIEKKIGKRIYGS